MNSPHWSSDALLMLQVLTLAMARPLGATLFLPFLSRQQVSGLARAALWLALSLPTAAQLWPDVQSSAPGAVAWLMLLVKEGLLGALLGLLMAVPFWSIRGMGTLIDNQRGANAAQQVNPALQADATLIGELAERALVALLIEWGALSSIYAVLSRSYAPWEPLALFPPLDAGLRLAVLDALVGTVGQALLLAAPVLLLLLLIELGLAIVSTTVQGVDVYGSAMPIKTLAALLLLMLTAPGLFDHAAQDAIAWWRDGLRDVLGWRQ